MSAHQILKQIEYYFSDSNFRRDKFLRESVDQDGFVTIEILLSFNKLKQLSTDAAVIAAAIVDSKSIELNEAKTAIRRIKALPEVDDSDARTLLLGGFGSEQPDIQAVKDLFPNCVIDSVRCGMHTKRFQGYAYVEFKELSDMPSAAIMLKFHSTRHIYGLPLTMYAALDKHSKNRIHRGSNPNPTSFLVLRCVATEAASFKEHRKSLKPLVSVSEMPYFELDNSKKLLVLSFASAAHAAAAMAAVQASEGPYQKEDMSLAENNPIVAKPSFTRDANMTKIEFANVPANVSREGLTEQLGDLWKSCDINRWVDFKVGQTKGELHMHSAALAAAVLKQVESTPVVFGEEQVVWKLKDAESYETGLIVCIESIPNGLTREVIKTTLNDMVSGNVAFIDFETNESTAFLRIRTAEAAQELVKLVAAGVEIEEGKKINSASVLTGDAEKDHWKKIQLQREARFSNKRAFDGGRGGGRGRGRGQQRRRKY